MKVLTTEQQVELQALMTELSGTVNDINLQGQINYWTLELKPKRVRRKAPEENIVSGEENA